MKSRHENYSTLVRCNVNLAFMLIFEIFVRCQCDGGFSGSGDTCTACAAGKFKAAPGSDECADCAAGKYSAATSALACDTCGANSNSAAGSSDCDCNAGYTGEHGQCTACHPGTYKAAAGSAECANCDAGKFTAENAAVSCTSCGSNADSGVGSSACVCNVGYTGKFVPHLTHSIDRINTAEC